MGTNMLRRLLRAGHQCDVNDIHPEAVQVLVKARMPEAIVNERRRRARAAAKKQGYTPSQAHLMLLAWNLFIPNVPATVGLPKTVGIAYALRWQVELGFRAWKSGLP
jgi:hypothetical protein